MKRLTTISRRLLRRWPLPLPENGDKNARGRILIVAGSPQMPGAAILAATAALRAGAGRLQVATCASIAPLVAAAIPEALVAGYAETTDGGISPAVAAQIAERAKESDALLVGPGMEDAAACAELVRAVVSWARVPTVVDAAALACVQDGDGVFQPLAGRAVLTPHAGEMARMLSRERGAVESHPVSCAAHAARRFNAVVALKGPETYIATPRGELYCNRDGPIGLATSGSGDTLAGVVAGLLARGMAPLHAAAWGVHAHARAGEALQRRMGIGFLARELLAEIPHILNG